MRYQGRIASWNSQRGFGFIKQEQGGADLFVHITTLQFDGRPPEVGEKVSYLIGSSKDGKPCAVQVFFPDRPLSLAGGPMPSMPDRGSREDLSPRAPHATTYRTREYHAPRRKGSWGGKLIPYWCWRGCSPSIPASRPSLPHFHPFPLLARRTVLRTVRFRFRLLFVSAMAVSIAPR